MASRNSFKGLVYRHHQHVQKQTDKSMLFDGDGGRTVLLSSSDDECMLSSNVP